MSRGFDTVLHGITRVQGVRTAALVSSTDGLVVAESSMEGTDTGALAALTASLVSRLGKAMAAAGQLPPDIVHLEAERGHVLARPAPADLLLVAVAEVTANVSLLRLALLEAAERLAP